MGKCTAKVTQTNLGTFRHNQTYPGNIQGYSDIFRILCYPDIFYDCDISRTPYIFRTRSKSRTLVYSEPRYIQNLAYSKFEAYLFRALSHIYDETLIIFMAVIIFTNCNYYRKVCRVETNILR